MPYVFNPLTGLLDIVADPSDEVSISRHEFPRNIIIENDILVAAFTDCEFTEIISHTPPGTEDVIFRVFKIKADTYGTFRVKIDGDIKDYYRTSPMRRNCIFEFIEDLEVPNGSVMTVEFAPRRTLLETYNFFFRGEGYYKEP
jgi:hypothetical protein